MQPYSNLNSSQSAKARSSRKGRQGRRFVKKSQNKNQLRGSQYPRQMVAQRPVRYHFRYQFLASQLDTVNGSVLLSQIVFAISATASYRIFSAVRIRKLELWAAGALGSTGSSIPQNQIGLEWFGTTNSYNPSVQITDVTMGAHAGHIVSKPPRGSSADNWISQGGQWDTTDTIFSTNGSIGAVVDLWMDCVIVDSETQSAGPTTTGMTAGRLYYNYLDGRGSSNIQPFSSVRILT